jgi:hypothetical protein
MKETATIAVSHHSEGRSLSLSFDSKIPYLNVICDIVIVTTFPSFGLITNFSHFTITKWKKFSLRERSKLKNKERRKIVIIVK